MGYYKDNVKGFGFSDIATLTLMYCDSSGKLGYQAIEMAGDGHYNAYIVKGNAAAIPGHYTRTISLSGLAWFRVYDDYSCVYESNAAGVDVYRAGSYGLYTRGGPFPPPL